MARPVSIPSLSKPRPFWPAGRSALGAAAAIVLLTTSSPIAHEAAPQTTDRNWASWLDAVNAHVPGKYDEAVTRVAPWSLAQLDSVLPELPRQPDRGVRAIERALVLHMDIAIFHREADGYSLPPGPGEITLLNDGRAVGRMSRTVHWEFSRRLVERAPSRTERTRIGRPFYRATAALLQLWGEYPELTAHFAGARDAALDDAVLLMYEGTMQQAYAGPRLQRFFDERRRAEAKERPTMNRRLPPGAVGTSTRESIRLPADFPSAEDSRERAERSFRRALDVDPALAEARIRLAHVLGDAGRHAAAVAELRRATNGPLPPLLDYYAALLTGRATRALGRLDEARAAFERAAALYPTAPSPRFGLSEIALARHDFDGSLAHLEPRDRGGRIDVDDPWWRLERSHEPSARALVDDLRESVPR